MLAISGADNFDSGSFKLRLAPGAGATLQLGHHARRASLLLAAQRALDVLKAVKVRYLSGGLLERG